MNNVYVIDPESKAKLVEQGFKVVNELHTVNGGVVWVMHSLNFNFDIDSMNLPGVIRSERFDLKFLSNGGD